jgi:hypothetical protein
VIVKLPVLEIVTAWEARTPFVKVAVVPGRGPPRGHPYPDRAAARAGPVRIADAWKTYAERFCRELPAVVGV